MSGSLDILRKSLAANGLPTSGNKADMLERLLSGTKDKRKKSDDEPEPKVAKVDTVQNMDVASNASADYLKYAAQERANLLASGITDDDTINAEINRRWGVMKAVSSPVAPSPQKKTVTLPIMLDAEGLAEANLTFVTQTEDGKFMYVRNPTPSKPPAPATRNPASATEKKASPASDKAKPTEGKRKAEPEPAPEENDEEDMSWPCEVSSMRIQKKCKTKQGQEAVKSMLKFFGVPPTGTFAEQANALSEQLHYETDEEE